MTERRVVWPLGLAVLALVGLVWWLLPRSGDEPLAPARAARDPSAATSQALSSAAESSTSPDVTAPAPLPLAPPDPTAASATPASAATPGSLVVHVLWKADGSPAAGIGLRLLELDQRDPLFHPILGRTGDDGRWILEDRPAGRVIVYTDRKEADGGRIAAGQRTELTIELPPGVLVRGTVVDGEQRPVAGAEIWLDGFDSAGAIATVGRADNVGRFAVSGVQRGQSVGASVTGRTRSWSVRVEQSTPDPYDITLELGPPGGRVQGVVSDPDARPVAGATVLVGSEAGFLPGKSRPPYDVRWPPPYRLLTDERGAFAADDVPAGAVQVAVRATGWSPWSGMIKVDVGMATDVPVALQPSASVTGVVRDSAGTPLADAHVTTRGRGEMLLQFCFSDAEGRFTLRDLPLGSIDFSANRDGAGQASTTLRVEAGGAYVWDPVLGSGLLIRGRVIDGSGAPLGGWRVHAIPQEGDQSSTKTDADGRFTLDQRADVPHRVDVDAPSPAGALAAATLSDVRPGPEEIEIVVPGGAGTAVVVGRVEDARRQPVGGARVYLTQSATERMLHAWSEAASGAFRFGPLPAGRYALEIEAEGLPGLVVPEFELAAGELRDLGALAFETPGTLLVRVTVPEGVDAANNSAAAFPTDGGSGAMLERQPDGTLLSPPLRPGDYRVRAWGAHLAMKTLTAHVSSDQCTELDVALVACHWHSVYLTMPLLEEAAPSLAVEIRDRAGVLVFDRQPPVQDHSDEHVRRALVQACLPAADYSLQVRSNGQLVLDVPLLLAGATEDVGRSDFELP